MKQQRSLTILSALVMVLFVASCNTSDTASAITEPAEEETALKPLSAALQLVLEDMTLPHEGVPNGVRPEDGWWKKPRIGYGNRPPAGWNAVLPWGQVYTDKKGNTTVNTRFQIRNIQIWYLSKADTIWKKWAATSDMDGANYAEDFQNDMNVAADIRDETTNGGGISATLITDYNFHFWKAGNRIQINPDDISAIWTSLESRLILDDPNGIDDRDKARIMMSAGADYWEDVRVPWDQWKTNGDIFIGRFRYLTTNWQTFHGHTLTEEILRNNPPPLN